MFTETKKEGRHAGETANERIIRLSNYHVRLIATRNQHERNVQKRTEELAVAEGRLNNRGDTEKGGRAKQVRELAHSIATSRIKQARLTKKIHETENKLLPKRISDLDW